MKPFDLVRIPEDLKERYKHLGYDNHYVFLGEITQMPGHGVFVVVGTNTILAGLHMDSFEVVEG